MDKREILEIVAENWLNRPSADEAIIAAYGEIGRKVLGKLIGQLGHPITQKNWEILLQMNEANSRMSYFRLSGPASIMDKFRTISLFFLFDAWESAAQYLYAHYDDACPEAEEQRKAGSKEEMEKIIDKVATLIQEHILELGKSGKVRIPLGEFEVMEETFGSVMLLILSRKGFETFMSEFNKTLPILKRVLRELSSQSKKTGLSSN